MKITPLINFGLILFLSIFIFNINNYALNPTIIYYILILIININLLKYITKNMYALFFIVNFFLIFTLYLSPCNNFLSKGFLTLLVLNIFFIGNIITNKICNKLYKYDSYEPVAIIFLLAVIIYGLIFQGTNKIITSFYLEPSHLALIVSPLIGYLVSSRNYQISILGFIFSLFFYFYSPSNTIKILLPLSFFIGILISDYNYLKRLFLILSILIFSYLIIDSREFLERVTDLFSTKYGANLSSLVYSYGFESGLNSIRQTSGIGLGINMMGCHTDTPFYNFYEDQLRIAGRVLEVGSVVNYNDGSFLMAKMASEFGIISLIILFILFIYPLISIYKKNNYSNSEVRMIFIVLSVNMAGIFIRGTSYLFGGFLLAIFASTLFYSKYNVKKY